LGKFNGKIDFLHLHTFAAVFGETATSSLPNFRDHNAAVHQYHLYGASARYIYRVGQKMTLFQLREYNAI